MKKPILFIKSLIFASILFVGCDSSDDIECPEALTGELSEKETSFTGTWSLISVVTEDEIDLTDDDTENPTTDLYSQLPDCENDMVYTFETDRTYTYYLGKNAADCATQQEITGTWQLTENNNLVFVTNCSSGGNLIEFNEDETEFSFEATYNFTDVDGYTITTKTTFTYGKSI